MSTIALPGLHFVTPVKPALTARADDPRIGDLLGSNIRGDTKPRALLVGFPTDEGVQRNHGRVGAARGPEAIRRAFYRLTSRPDDPRFLELIRNTIDLGDLVISKDLEASQALLGTLIEHALTAGIIPIVLGGGHETSFGHFLGYVGAQRAVQTLNFDTHADVRPLIDGRGHSGSAFRQMLEHPSKLCRNYSVLGLHPYSLAQAHIDFLKAHQARYYYEDELDAALLNSVIQYINAPTLVSFDLDVIQQAFAPGVSSPAAGGISPDLLFRLAKRCGSSTHCQSFDICEMNPTYDQDNATARVAAVLVWNILAGISCQS